MNGPPDSERETAELPEPSDGPAETVELPEESAGEVAETVEVAADEPQETVDLARAETVELPEREAGGERAGGEPETIGPYELRALLGSGGMGKVYRAFHPGLERDVALKLLTAVGNPEHARRFALEARAAARLKHPNVVAIHDVGEDAGRPYLVMDLVEGESLADRIAREPLAPREAARLTRDVARALAHAHGQQVLHRDIKPGNVMLTAAGEPRLTDFGLAKDLGAEGGTVTETGVIMGTPAYMPPEQARGALEAIDRRADVYALGATLYELLTGDPPFTGQSALSVIHKVLHAEPRAPRTLKPELDVDLETICLKCLEKEPEARYDTASALAEDLDRYLAHQTITARRPTTGERLGKWVRRNRALAQAVGVTLAAALLIGVVGTVAFVLRLDAAKEQAEDAQRTAETAQAEAEAAQRKAEADAVRATQQAWLAREALDALIYEVQDELGDLPGPAIRAARRRLLREALEKLDRLDPSVGRVGRKAEVARQRAEIELTLGRTERADAACAAAFAELPAAGADGARAQLLLLRARIRISQGRSADAVAAARAAAKLGEPPQRIDALSRLARLLVRQGELKPARAALEQARELVQGPARASVLDELSRLCVAQGDLKAAKGYAEEALVLVRADRQQRPESKASGLNLLTALNGLGEIALEQEQQPEGLSRFTEALTLARRLAAQDPEDARIAHSLLVALGGRARALERGGKLAEALKLYEQVLVRARAALARDAEDWGARESLVVALLAVGTRQLYDWRLEPALGSFAEARREAARLAQHDPRDQRLGELHLGAVNYAGVVHLRRGELAAAQEAAELVIARSRAMLAKDPKLASAGRRLAVALGQLGAIQERQVAEARALNHYQQAVAVLRRLLKDDPSRARLKRNLAASLGTIGQLHYRAGRLAKAEASLQEAAQQLAALSGEAPTDRTVSRGGLAAFLQQVRAERARVQALQQGTEPGSPYDHWLLARALSAADPARALPHFRAALRDPRLRDRPQPAVLPWAIRTAVRASQRATGEEQTQLRAEALTWLEGFVRRYRQLIGGFEQALQQGGLSPPDTCKYIEVRDKLQAHIRRLAEDDALKPLRADPRYRALFPAAER